MEVTFEQYRIWCAQLDGRIREGWTEEPVPEIEHSPPVTDGDIAQWCFSFGPPLLEPGPKGKPVEAVLLIRPEAFPAAGHGHGSGDLFRELGSSRWQGTLWGVAQGVTPPMTLFEGVTVERPAAD